MNDLYFVCGACRAYIDAGYRHAYWALEDPGVVTRTNLVDTAAVLEADEYWDVDAEWLQKLLPVVRRFLECHSMHGVRFGEAEELDIPLLPEEGLFDWVMDAGFVVEELPRYYVEHLGLRTWQQVIEHVEASERPPHWWESEEERGAAQQKFLGLVAAL